jgi:hypothetical protein
MTSPRSILAAILRRQVSCKPLTEILQMEVSARLRLRPLAAFCKSGASLSVANALRSASGPPVARRITTNLLSSRGALSPHAGDEPQDRRSALIARDRLSALAICAIQDFLCGRDSRLIALRFKGEPGQLFKHGGAVDAREIADFRGHLV